MPKGITRTDGGQSGPTPPPKVVPDKGEKGLTPPPKVPPPKD